MLDLIEAAALPKENPPKAGFLGFFLGVLPCFHSEEKPSSMLHPECRLAQSHLFEQLADWHRLCVLNGEATPHTRIGIKHPPSLSSKEAFLWSSWCHFLSLST